MDGRLDIEHGKDNSNKISEEVLIPIRHDEETESVNEENEGMEMGM